MDAAVVLDNFTAIEFLANGDGNYHKPILLMNVSWQEYTGFLKEFEERAGWRLAYDDGSLEIMPPLREHEKPKDTIFLLVYEYCSHLGILLETGGSTTFRRKTKDKGVEPDTCFYVQNAEKNIDLTEKLKPETYPVPDVAVEIDVTHGSLDKFKIYAALGVPELWIYNGKTVNFYRLANDAYDQSQMSLAFPQLSSTLLTKFLKMSETTGQSVALKAFREHLNDSLK